MGPAGAVRAEVSKVDHFPGVDSVGLVRPTTFAGGISAAAVAEADVGVADRGAVVGVPQLGEVPDDAAVAWCV